MDRTFLALGALLGLLGVVFGALGDHVVHGHVSPFMYSVYETAVRYQFYHALGLMLIGVSAAHLRARAWLRAAGWLMFAGVMMFSGSLYLLVLVGARGFGFIAPIGGTSLIIAWLLYFVAILRSPR